MSIPPMPAVSPLSMGGMGLDVGNGTEADEFDFQTRKLFCIFVCRLVVDDDDNASVIQQLKRKKRPDQKDLIVRGILKST